MRKTERERSETRRRRKRERAVSDAAETRERKLRRVKREEEGYFCLICSKFNFSKIFFFSR